MFFFFFRRGRPRRPGFEGEVLREDEEVKLAFDELDTLEKKFLGASRAYEQLMVKAMAKDPRAVDMQKKLAEYTAKIRQANTQPRR